MNRRNYNEGEYIQYALELERVVSELEENLHESDDPDDHTFDSVEKLESTECLHR